MGAFFDGCEEPFSAFEEAVEVLDLTGQSATRWMWSRASSVDEKLMGHPECPSSRRGGRPAP